MNTNTERLNELLYERRKTIADVVRTVGRPGLYSDFVKVRNNSGFVSQKQCLRVLKMYAEVLDVDVSELQR